MNKYHKPNSKLLETAIILELSCSFQIFLNLPLVDEMYIFMKVQLNEVVALSICDMPLIMVVFYHHSLWTVEPMNLNIS